MTDITIPDITLNSDTTIPQLGFGTLAVPPDREPTPENTAKTAEVVGQALALGYRRVDTAQMYGNERGVGQAIADSGLARDELFVTSKLGNGEHRPDDVRRSFEETMDKLGLDQLDLFLMHWPLPTLYDGDYVSTWQAMADLRDGGRLHAVGVSNFHPEHLDRIVAETGVVPAVNQIEVHPYLPNTAAREACARHGVAVESWSPLARGKLLDDATIARIAAEHDVTPAQVILRWHVEQDLIVIPKSMRQERMQENLGAFTFTLSAEEVDAISALDQGAEGRIGPNPDTFDWIPE